MAEGAPKIALDLTIPQSGRPFWRAPWCFVVHAVIGTSIFAVISGFAVGLDLSVGWLAKHEISNLVIWGLKVAEYSLFSTDECLFGVFLWRTARRSLKEL